MNLLELALKPRIAKDSFKPIWLRKLYTKVILIPCGIVYIVHAALKYDGDMLQDRWLRKVMIELHNAGGKYRETVYKFFKFNDEIKEMFKETKQNS